MRRIKRPSMGEYVLVTKYSDRDPLDPWYVGYISAIIETAQGMRYMVDGSDRRWRYVFRVSQAEGEEWLRLYAAANEPLEYPMRSE